MPSSSLFRGLTRQSCSIGKWWRSRAWSKARRLADSVIPRLDDQIVFNRLAPASTTRIVDLRLSELNRALGERRIKLNVDKTARDWLSKHGHDPVYGARALNRLIGRKVRKGVSPSPKRVC
jgi:ATP-dependent Clp protease ATP-binding subunit ClpA